MKLHEVHDSQVYNTEPPPPQYAAKVKWRRQQIVQKLTDKRDAINVEITDLRQHAHLLRRRYVYLLKNVSSLEDNQVNATAKKQLRREQKRFQAIQTMLMEINEKIADLQNDVEDYDRQIQQYTS